MPHRVCPFWLGYLLANPLRKLFQDPKQILAPYIQSGMTVIDVGCAMGFFSLPLADLVGEGGKVVCIDLQQKMLQPLQKRAKKVGFDQRIIARQCTETSLCLDDLKENIDFAFSYAVVHEVPNPAGFFSEIYAALKPKGSLLLGEPRLHVSKEDFTQSLSFAESKGFTLSSQPVINGSHTALLAKT